MFFKHIPPFDPQHPTCAYISTYKQAKILFKEKSTEVLLFFFEFISSLGVCRRDLCKKKISPTELLSRHQSRPLQRSKSSFIDRNSSFWTFQFAYTTNYTLLRHFLYLKQDIYSTQYLFTEEYISIRPTNLHYLSIN